jgi:adenylate cyclase
MIKKILLSHWTALITLTLVVLVRVIDPSFVESIRLRYFDTLITAKAPTENNIISVNIDEDALDKYGQWPFSRDIYGSIIEDLYQRNAGLVVFNVLMPEKDRLGGDAALAKTIANNPVIIPSVASIKSKNTPKNPGASVIGADYADMIVQFPGIISSIDIISEHAAGVGIINTLPEIDGVNRRLPMLVTAKHTLYPSLSMEVLRVVAGDPSFQVKLNNFGVEKMRIPAFGVISTDSLSRVWIDWSQHNQSISLSQLPNDFGGAIVIVGPTAAGISNPISTPKGPIFPNDIQAAMIGTMMNKVTINRPDYSDGAEILVGAVCGILLIIGSLWRKR